MRTIAVLLLSITLYYAGGQGPSKDLPQSKEVEFISWVNNELGPEEWPIYNGATYPLVKKAKFGHQFFGNIQWQSGSVKYLDRWFFDVQLLYDITSNKLMVKPRDATQTFGILLEMAHVQAFSIGGSFFKKVPELDSRNFFYEVLYSGEHLELIVRHVKEIELESSGAHAKALDTYLIKMDQGFVTLKNKKSLEEIDPNSKAIAKEIKSSDAKFDLRKPDLLVNFIRKFNDRIE